MLGLKMLILAMFYPSTSCDTVNLPENFATVVAPSSVYTGLIISTRSAPGQVVAV